MHRILHGQKCSAINKGDIIREAPRVTEALSI